MSQFYVTLPSNSVNTRENTTAEFRVNLAHALEFTGQWEVGLCSIQYPFTWENFTTEKFLYYILKSKVIQVSLPPGNYENIQELTDALTHAYRQSIVESADLLANSLKMSSKQVIRQYLKALNFKYNKTLKRVEIGLNGVDKVLLSTNLHYTLGMSLKDDNFAKGYSVGQYPPDLSAG
jgi:hypothetical protein